MKRRFAAAAAVAGLTAVLTATTASAGRGENMPSLARSVVANLPAVTAGNAGAPPASVPPVDHANAGRASGTVAIADAVNTNRVVADESHPRPVPPPSHKDNKPPEHAVKTCATAAQGTQSFSTQADFDTAISHPWMLCAPPSVFGSNEAGLDIRPDHTWSKLVTDDRGRFVDDHGFGNEGTWESVDTSAMNGPRSWQLNLYANGSGEVVTAPVIAKNVPKMRLDNEGVYTADYAELRPSDLAKR